MVFSIEAISKTQPLVAEFSKLSNTVALMDDVLSARELCRWFGNLFERYNLPQGYSGPCSQADHDYFKFLGHEMMVTLVALLLREQKWATLQSLLDEPIPMRYIPNQGPGNVGWEYASEHLPLLLHEGEKTRRVSLQADLLKERHSNGGGLAAVLPFTDFMDADYFLFLLSQRLPDQTGIGFRYWRAWSSLYLSRAPAFLQNAERKRIAQGLLTVFGFADIEGFKKFLVDNGPKITELYRRYRFGDSLYGSAVIDKIGTR